jgi:hypothetical protein
LLCLPCFGEHFSKNPTDYHLATKIGSEVLPLANVEKQLITSRARKYLVNWLRQLEIEAFSSVESRKVVIDDEHKNTITILQRKTQELKDDLDEKRDQAIEIL